jgi:hypothetical protein
MKRIILASAALVGTLLWTARVAAVECYPEDKVKADLDKKGYTLEQSTKAEKMELFAYASAQEKRWVLFAKPEAGMVKGAPADEAMLCPLDADEGDVESMKKSDYFQKFFAGQETPPPATNSSAQP